MNRAGALWVPLSMTNPFVGLNTVPVGAPPGMLTTSGAVTGMLPRTPPEYSVDTSVPLSATHNGVAGPADSPHGVTRVGSVMRATPGMSDTRLRCVNAPVPGCPVAPASPAPARATATVARSAASTPRQRVGHHLQRTSSVVLRWIADMRASFRASGGAVVLGPPGRRAAAQRDAARSRSFPVLGARPTAPPPVLGEVGVLEEDDVVVGPRRGDGVPDLIERGLLVVGFDGHLERADLVGLADGRVRQRSCQLLAGL